MSYQIIYHRNVEKFLDKVPDKIYLQISSKIRELANNPYSPFLDIKKLVGGEDEYRLRVGEYRILYSLENKKLYIYIINIAHRKDVYK